MRHDVVDSRGADSLRYKGRMLHLGVGYRHRGERVILHIVDERVRVLSEHYVLIGQATINLAQGYQPVTRVE